MDIRYRSDRSPIAVQDILDDALAFWQPGEVKTVEGVVRVRSASIVAGELVFAAKMADAVTAVLNLGPDFVDDATGKNPNFVCAECSVETNADYFQPVDVPVFYRDARGRLCIPCYLRSNPRAHEFHRRRGVHIESIVAAPAASATTVAPAVDAASAQTDKV